MNENKNGWIRLHRRIMDGPDWLAEPFTRAQAWVDLLLLANHKTGFIRRRGIMVAVERGQVGYSEDALAARWQWSKGKARRFLSELMRLSRISRKISEKTVLKKTSVSALIYIVNYEKYQASGNENGTEDGPKTVTEQEEKEEKEEKTPEKISAEISALIKKYDQKLIQKCFDAIRSTRKTATVADSVLLVQLRKWEQYPVEQVESAIRVFLDRDYASQGKNEDYLFGIIRNQRPKSEPEHQPQPKEITMENLGELHAN